MAKKEIYFSVDIEADGPIPGSYSMLSFAAVAFTITNHEMVIIDEMEANLELLPNASQHPETMTIFWLRNQEAYEASREKLQDPKEAMQKFNKWAKQLAKNTNSVPVMVEYPGVFDFMWIYWYSIYFLDECAFGFTGMSMKSYANAMLKHKHFKSSTKRSFPKDWFIPNKPHTHIALDDAREQAYLFASMRKANLQNDE